MEQMNNNIVTSITVDGVSHSVLSYLDRESKHALAYDIVARTVFIDEDTGLTMISPYEDVDTFMLLLGAYTNIETPEDMFDRIQLFDKVMSNGLVSWLDADAVLKIAAHMRDNFIKANDERATLSHTIKKMLPELTENESLSETLSKGGGMVEFLAGLMKIATIPQNASPAPNTVRFGKRKK